MKSKILKTILLLTGIILAYNIKTLAVENGTIRMEIKDSTAWNNIDVSTAYNECESLNSTTSSLGTSALKAHLTTDEDWSIMAIFSVSQYGGSTTNNPTWTTNNVTGIKGVRGWHFTTGILNTATRTSTSYISGFFNEDGSVKKYVKQWSPTRTNNNFVGFTDTYGWYGCEKYWGSSTSSPISCRNGLFGFAIGNSNPVTISAYAAGAPSANVTFRAAIWN